MAAVDRMVAGLLGLVMGEGWEEELTGLKSSPSKTDR
jgi:hypothetical protein